jgi:nitrate/nitrite transport system substrate-binding protein
MRRWGQIAEYKSDDWYMDMAKQVYRPDIYAAAAKELIAEGKAKAEDFPDFDKETGFRPPQKEFIDNVTFDGTKPNAYLESFKIGLKGKDVVK